MVTVTWKAPIFVKEAQEAADEAVPSSRLRTLAFPSRSAYYIEYRYNKPSRRQEIVLRAGSGFVVNRFLGSATAE